MFMNCDPKDSFKKEDESDQSQFVNHYADTHLNMEENVRHSIIHSHNNLYENMLVIFQRKSACCVMVNTMGLKSCTVLLQKMLGPRRIIAIRSNKHYSGLFC
jgi:hypothetical protein